MSIACIVYVAVFVGLFALAMWELKVRTDDTTSDDLICAFLMSFAWPLVLGILAIGIPIAWLGGKVLERLNS